MLLENLPHRCSIYVRTKAKGALGDARYTRTLVRANLECWEQKVSTSQIALYAKRGMNVTTRVYFTEDPGVTDAHEIVITKRNGVAVPTASQHTLQGLLADVPDAGAGLGVLFAVIGSYMPGGDV